MTFTRISVLGSGVIGSAWAIVYARAGCRVTIYERSAERRATVMHQLRAGIRESASLVSEGETVDDVLSRIGLCDTLAAALEEAQFVHECIEEKLDSKKAIFGQLNECAGTQAVLASATSSFPVSHFASELACRDRCIVVHPATPPHLLPVTEICPAPFTSDRVISDTTSFMRDCGQIPVHIRKEVEGFALNRMQAALIVEMLTLLKEGIVDAHDLDAIISEGFGLRWAFLGPLEGVDLNATGGIRQYLANFGFLFSDRARDYGLGEVLPPETVDALEAYARSRIPLDALPEKVAWRDQSILALRALKAERGTTDRG